MAAWGGEARLLPPLRSFGASSRFQCGFRASLDSISGGAESIALRIEADAWRPIR
jgi:hypothetical protein